MFRLSAPWAIAAAAGGLSVWFADSGQAHAQAGPAGAVTAPLRPNQDGPPRAAAPISDHRPSADDGSPARLFRCQLEQGGDLTISLDPRVATGPKHPPAFRVAADARGAKFAHRFIGAKAYEQVDTQAKTLTVKWSDARLVAKLDYHTDWQPTLVQFASLAVDDGGKTVIYKCHTDRIFIPTVVRWRFDTAMKTPGMGFNIWLLPYYGYADPMADDEGN